MWRQLCTFQKWRHPSSRILDDVISRRLTSKSMSVHVVVSYFKFYLNWLGLSWVITQFDLPRQRGRESARNEETQRHFQRPITWWKIIFFEKKFAPPRFEWDIYRVPNFQSNRLTHKNFPGVRTNTDGRTEGHTAEVGGLHEAHNVITRLKLNQFRSNFEHSL